MSLGRAKTRGGGNVPRHTQGMSESMRRYEGSESWDIYSTACHGGTMIPAMEMKSADCEDLEVETRG